MNSVIDINSEERKKEMDGRKCLRCKKDYPATLDYFYINSMRKDGLCVICKKCNKECSKEYYKNNKDRIKEYRRKNKSRSKKYYLDNKDHLTKYQKEYKIKNKDRIKEYQKEYYKNNKESITEQRKEYKKMLNKNENN